MLLYCCTHYFIITLVQFVLHILTSHITFTIFLLYYTALCQCIMFYHTGSMKDYQLHFLLFGVEFIAVSCYENIENRLPVCQFLICIYWFYSILSVMVDYKYLKMYYFDLFPVFQWEWAVFWPGTRKAQMLGLKTEKAISTKKKLHFI